MWLYNRNDHMASTATSYCIENMIVTAELIFYHLWMLSLLFLVSFFSSAQVGPTIDAMGGAGIASRQPIDAAHLNPAALTSLQEYYFGAGYFRGKTQSAGVDQSSVTLADATPDGLIPGAFSYRFRKYRDGADLKEHFFRLGLAVPVTRQFSLGVAGYKLKTDLRQGIDYKQENADLSLLWAISPSLALGVVSKTIFGSKDNVAFLDSKLLPSTGAGFEWSQQLFKFRTDLYYYYENNPDQRLSYHFGGEAQMVGEFKLRAGLAVDDYRRENRYSVGLGWDGPRLRAAYTFQNEFRKDLGNSHTFDFWLYL